MATILVDARNVTAEPGGVGRYALALIPKLAAAAPEHRFVVLRHASNTTPIDADVAEIVVDAQNDDAWHVLWGHRVIEEVADQVNADLYHSLFHVLPARSLTVATVMTAHDFIWIDYPELAGKTGLFGKAEQVFWSRAIVSSLESAREVIHVSATTQRRAKELMGSWDGRRHHVVHHGVAKHYFGEPPPLSAAYEAVWEAGPVIACVGNAKEYKNLHTVVRALDRMKVPDVQLVLIGRCEGVERHATDKTRGRVHLAGIADDIELHALVGHCDLFVFPSLVEGFGMPPLEAMAMGRATAVSARQPMLEVCEGGAQTFHALDVEDLAATADAILGDQDAREAAQLRAREHASDFTWERAAEETLGVYRRALEES